MTTSSPASPESLPEMQVLRLGAPWGHTPFRTYWCLGDVRCVSGKTTSSTQAGMRQAGYAAVRHPAGLLDPGLPVKKASNHGGRGLGMEPHPSCQLLSPPHALSRQQSLPGAPSTLAASSGHQMPHRKCWRIVGFAVRLSYHLSP